MPVYAPSIANSKQLIQALGDDARGLAMTQIVPYPMRATTPLTRDFAAASERAKLPNDFDHFFGYLNMRVLFEEYVGRMKVVGAAGVTPRNRRPRKKPGGR